MSSSIGESVNTDKSGPAISTVQRSRHYLLLDALRGLASVMVVAYHWSEIATRRTPELASNLFYQWSHWGGLGVQIFFVISGYSIANAAAVAIRRGQGLREYLWARARRIYPTYWAGLILMVVFAIAAHAAAQRGLIQENVFTQFDLSALSPAYVFGNLTLTSLLLRQMPLLVVAWTLCYEVAFYLLVGIGLLAGRFALRRASTGEVEANPAAVERGEAVLLTILHCLTIGTFGVLVLSPRALFYPLDLWPQFGMGVVAYDVLARPKAKAPRVWLGTAVLLCLTYAVLHNEPSGFLQQAGRVCFPVATLMAIALVGLRPWDARLAALPVLRVLGAIGVFSYSLYLTHFIIIRIAGQILTRIGMPASLHYLTFALVMAIAVGVAYVFYLAFEKPVLRSRRKTPTSPGESNPVGKIALSAGNAATAVAPPASVTKQETVA